jgi:hypothetical protein
MSEPCPCPRPEAEDEAQPGPEPTEPTPLERMVRQVLEQGARALAERPVKPEARVDAQFPVVPGWKPGDAMTVVGSAPRHDIKVELAFHDQKRMWELRAKLGQLEICLRELALLGYAPEQVWHDTWAIDGIRYQGETLCDAIVRWGVIERQLDRREDWP